MIIKANQRNISTKENFKGGTGAIEFKQIANENDLFGKIKMFNTLTLKKGCGLGYHTHVGEEELMMILEGKATYNDDGQITTIEKDDIVICKENHYHGITNDFDEDVKYIAIIVEN